MEEKKKCIHYVRIALVVLISICGAVFLLEAQMNSANFHITSSSLNSGGGRAGSAHFGVRTSTGQATPAGISQSPHFGLFAGFQAYSLDNFVLPTYQRGDVNGDMSVNVLDVIVTVNHILGTILQTGDALIRADCNADGEIDVLDCLGIVNVILGTGECEP